MGTDRKQLLGSVITAVVMAFGLGFWTHLLEWRAAATVWGQSSFFADWMRDSMIAVPFVIIAVLLVQRITRRWSPLSRITAVAVGSAAAVAVGTSLQFAVRGAERAGGKGAVAATLTTFAVALPVALLIAGAAARLAAIDSSERRAFVRRILPRAGVAAVAAAIVSAASVVAPAPELISASTTPASACPTDAPVKSYDVQAINVDIPLNRWGDHDPAGKMYVLSDQVSAVRAEEKSREVSIGLREDPIQPLVIRANEGDCVNVTLTNNATGGSYGVSIDGVAFDTSADDVGINGSGETGAGQTRTYKFYVPNDPTIEGSHYLHPGPGHRDAVDHGLFGVLAVEPPGSTYHSPLDLREIRSGWEAVIEPAGNASFRENVQILHEIGNESESVYDKNNKPLPKVGPITETYRPGGRGFNYRSEPFDDRLANGHEHEKAHSYASTVFGDPATIIPRGYVGDPTKFRIVHAGAEVFHVYHLHGGGDRWRENPKADGGNDYADTGLKKTPVETSQSDRLDAQSTGPGESFSAEIESGAGGTQQGAGDFLFHCHVAEHYPAGMWGFWRVFDTLQPDVAPLPDRTPYQSPVPSDQLIGKTMPDGTVITAANLDAWIRPLLPPPGTPIGDQDASVWNWKIDNANPAAPVYLGEPEPTTAETPNFVQGVKGHFGSQPVDQFDGNRPKILFDPVNGRPAFPMLRPHLGHRPPWSANRHTGTPYLGEGGADPANTLPEAGKVKPWAGRADALCPEGAPIKNFNVVAVPVPVQVTKRLSDAAGLLFTLAQDKAALLAGQRKTEPLAIRANVGDCANVTLTSEEKDELTFGGYAKVEMHIHHVQFDPQGSDGTSVGFSFEHSIRPYTIEDTRLSQATAVGDTSVVVDRVDPKYRPGVAFGIGLGQNSIEAVSIVSVDPSTRTITLDRPLNQAHAAGEGAGIEFIRYLWYADALLDNIFWHDHVDGIHGWGHGAVGQFIVEPRGSTYTDPATGAPLDSGTIADIHTTSPLAPGIVDGSFREMVIWSLQTNPVTDATFNLKAEPWSDRSSDPSLRFSSYTSGDPITPLLRAYPGDPVVIRSIHVGPNVDSFRVDGHKFYTEKRMPRDPSTGRVYSRVSDTIQSGVSERFTLMLDGGAGGVHHEPGDYLYHDGVARRFRQGAWGIMRVLGTTAADLQPLPGYPAPGGSYVQPAVTGGRPPVAANPGNPCPSGSTPKSFAVSAVDLPSSNTGSVNGPRAAYTLSNAAASAKRNGVAEPLVLHVAEGDCVDVTLKNERSSVRASFSVAEVAKAAASSGINIGFNPEQTVAPGKTQTYRFYVDNQAIESSVVADFGGDDTGKIGLYGAVVVAEPGATFTDPASGAAVTTGAQVDVHVPGKPGYRDSTLILSDNDPQIGSDFMPYPRDVSGNTWVNYRNAGRHTNSFSGTPVTPVLKAYAGDPMKIHVITAPGSDQTHVFFAGGLDWSSDPYMPNSQKEAQHRVSPHSSFDVHINGGAGGTAHKTGDFFYGDGRRAFTEGGMWGLIRVSPLPSCGAGSLVPRRLEGSSCG